MESEVLTGFLEALNTADPSRDRLAARLIWAGRRAGTHLVWADARHEQAKAQTAESHLLPRCTVILTFCWVGPSRRTSSPPRSRS
ncbi:hypothetical protein ACFQY4_26405 [Catellatospora bangladeshensis]|uniref:hypothetical protein n=1 Tax=Catellatospora bangladeshensis TaxID=310355 RepID=UPI003607E2AC